MCTAVAAVFTPYFSLSSLQGRLSLQVQAMKTAHGAINSKNDSNGDLQNETQLNKYHFMLTLDTDVGGIILWGEWAFSLTTSTRVRNLSSKLMN